jgi:predicted nucleotidyltransferase
VFGDSEQVKPILDDSGVTVAYLFGSRAREDGRPDSDADIAVLTDRRLDLLEREVLADRLARALGVPDVDLIVLREASLELRGHVVQTGTLLHSRDEPGRVAFESRTRSEWFEYRPVLEAHTRRWLRQLADQAT